LPRTSSGKLSRAKARTLYLSGDIQPYALAA
jgi:fatty-acyl-CoA synthase